MLQRHFLSLEVISGRYELQPAAWSDACMACGLCMQFMEMLCKEYKLMNRSHGVWSAHHRQIWVSCCKQPLSPWVVQQG